MRPRGERSARALGVLVEIRRSEENDALARMSESRQAANVLGERAADIRRRRAELVEEMTARPLDFAQRRYLESLRTREARIARRVEELEREWTAHQESFVSARARRQASEALHGRRAGAIRAREEAEVERSIEDQVMARSGRGGVRA